MSDSSLIDLGQVFYRVYERTRARMGMEVGIEVASFDALRVMLAVTLFLVFVFDLLVYLKIEGKKKRYLP